ncbi:MAG TPA: sodium:proton antiporter [Alphaproteobacteria bacterium]|jgi:Na+/H+ antiporter NhaD/arsenite permease-like protein
MTVRTLSVAGLVALASLHASAAFAATDAAPHVDGAALGLIWVAPFAGILLSIALMPLLAPRIWHAHYGKIALFWALAFFAPFTVAFGPSVALYEALHTLLLEYVPFILLLLALFTVAGGIRIVGHPHGTPAVNTAFLAVGTLIASLMGTTGAAMLLIRPLIEANAWRQRKVHVVVFFIFLVANIGGSLTPLGDPPLFLGFLKGVPFFWPTVHMFLPMALAAGLLLAIFYGLDRRLCAKEAGRPPQAGEGGIRIEGKVNLLLLAGVVGAVLLSGLWKSGVAVTVYHVPTDLEALVRDVILLAIVAASLALTPAESRRANNFDWEPMREVAKLFAGIFLTIVPAIAILRAGESGALRAVVAAVSDEAGQPVDAMYFWLTGILSSFLDNAPTYLVFFNTAGGDPATLTGPLASTLLAISAGAVFMGANTYIGNAPNFMVRAIAEQRGVSMPSFFGYMLWSGAFLLPVFVLTTLVFFL